MLMRLVILLIISTALASCSRSPDAFPAAQPQASVIYGQASDCFAGTTIFHYGEVEILVFPVDRSPEIVRQLRLFPDKPSEKPEDWAKVRELVEQFLELVKRNRSQAKRVKADAEGRFRVETLSSGKEYIVIAILPPSEDSEESFLDRRTGKLAPGSTQVDLWGSDIPKEKCVARNP